MPDALAQALALPGLGWLLVAVIAAGLVRGFSGFGSAMIIMPVASSVLSPVGALVLLTMTELFGPMPNLPGAWRRGDRADVGRLLLGAALAMPIGIWAVSKVSAEIFGWWVCGVVLVLLVLLIAGWRYRGALTPGLVSVTGALGGFFGAAGVAGPPVIMLYMASTLPPATIRANFLLYLFGIDLLMLLILSASGLLDSVAMIAGLVLAVPYMATNILGAALFVPRAEPVFRAVAYAIIAASALIGLPLWK
ncbi:MAG: sulfite exporter TauE/SafE family protein [Sedimentitalea sp.]|nr:sulfite exporter TauE/SafE family protein [Sedimentitalea sp.]